MNQIISMHGWGSDSNIWRNWMSSFSSNKWIWQNGERGYGNLSPFLPSWESTYDNNKYLKKVVICHSLGIHLVKESILKSSTHIILINSFSGFIPRNKQSRQIAIALKGMKEAIGKGEKEEKMLLNFLTKSSSPNSIDSLFNGPIPYNLSTQGRQRLLNDLELLINTSKLPRGFPGKSNILVVNSEEDLIVTKPIQSQLLMDLNKNTINPICYWRLPNEGHSSLGVNLMLRVKDWLTYSL